MRAMFANLTPADFEKRSKKDLHMVEHQRVHVLFDEIQVAVYLGDLERVDCLMVRLGGAMAARRRTR